MRTVSRLLCFLGLHRWGPWEAGIHRAGDNGDATLGVYTVHEARRRECLRCTAEELRLGRPLR